MLNKAIKLASTSQQKDRFTLCAIITDKKGRMLSIGWNSYTKTHTKMMQWSKQYGNENRIFLHAETSAILKLKYTDKPYAIYVARINKNGDKTLMARPCEICYNIIRKMGIREIYYTTNNGYERIEV